MRSYSFFLLMISWSVSPEVGSILRCPVRNIPGGCFVSMLEIWSFLKTSCFGDSVESPLTIAVFWSGVRFEGSNSFRPEPVTIFLNVASRSEEHTSELQSRGHL